MFNTIIAVFSAVGFSSWAIYTHYFNIPLNEWDWSIWVGVVIMSFIGIFPGAAFGLVVASIFDRVVRKSHPEDGDCREIQCLNSEIRSRVDEESDVRAIFESYSVASLVCSQLKGIGFSDFRTSKDGLVITCRGGFGDVACYKTGVELNQYIYQPFDDGASRVKWVRDAKDANCTSEVLE